MARDERVLFIADRRFSAEGNETAPHVLRGHVMPVLSRVYREHNLMKEDSRELRGSELAMEENRGVRFRDVAETYFSQTRVDCRYTIRHEHGWSRRDWIGLFKVGWLTVKEYNTFAWALAPEGYQKGMEANCSVAFHQSYLPKPGVEEYEFVYVDEAGEICAVSSRFSFAAPRPLDELVTLEQENSGDGEDLGEDLLLVVPKAQILQNLLEGCQHELQALHKKFESVNTEVERERERWKTDRDENETMRREMRSHIEELKHSLKESSDRNQELELKEMHSTSENFHSEHNGLLAERAESHQRIRELEQEFASLSRQKLDAEAELERMKERVKKMSIQRRDEEAERRDLQTEHEQALLELRVLQERLEAGERSTDALRRDLSELGSLQSHSHAELHQVRLQAAQLSLQLSQANLALREGQAGWAQEREALRQSAEMDKERLQKLSRELQKKEEWLQEERSERERLEMELGVEKDCNRELRASLRALQKEQEQHQLEKQELQEHIHVLELRLDTETDVKWAEAAATPICNESPTSAEDKLISQDSTEQSGNEDDMKRARPDEELCSSLSAGDRSEAISRAQLDASSC
ncbi:hypothetical protein DNTS_008285 [Danionella cerebrum]|uniref:SKICH domain-containing protein n=1 Tax=Danionella cerebrum TaxID=2873325 RepID=A0A553R6H3_9TELE|nr:hypothetical protein DNTS_008285 [Danionella translucida]